jgi:hypothetical protein
MADPGVAILYEKRGTPRRVPRLEKLTLLRRARIAFARVFRFFGNLLMGK